MADFVEVEPGYQPRPRTTPYMFGDYQPYECPITGAPIEGRIAHEENLKRNGCRLLEPGESREAARRQAEVFERNLSRDMDKIEEDLTRNFQA